MPMDFLIRRNYTERRQSESINKWMKKKQQQQKNNPKKKDGAFPTRRNRSEGAAVVKGDQ